MASVRGHGRGQKADRLVNRHGMGTFEFEEGLVGGSCYDAHKVSITDETMAKAHAADAVIFGSVGGPKWDSVPYDVRPEAGLLRLRKDLALYANLRPAVTYPALADASALKRELVEGLDIIILRELTGGVYFGDRRPSPIWATARSARSTRRSTITLRRSTHRPCRVDLRASARTRHGRWRAHVMKTCVSTRGASGRCPDR